MITHIRPGMVRCGRGWIDASFLQQFHEGKGNVLESPLKFDGKDLETDTAFVMVSFSRHSKLPLETDGVKRDLEGLHCGRGFDEFGDGHPYFTLFVSGGPPIEWPAFMVYSPGIKSMNFRAASWTCKGQPIASKIRSVGSRS